MARVPLLERAFGQDRLARQHRLVGFTSFNLMVAHVVLITWGYALGDLVQVPQTFWNLTVNYPGMLLALGGTARAGHGRGDQHQGGAEEAAVRVLAPDPPLRLPRRRPGAPPPAVDRHGLHLLARPHGLLVDGLGRSPPAPCSCGASACRCGRNAAARPPRHQRRARGTRRLVGLRHRPAVAPAARRGRPVPGLAVPRAGRAGPAPTRTRSPPPRTGAACASRSRRPATAARPWPRSRPGTRVLVEGPYGRLTDRARTRDRVALLRRGRRDHPAPRPRRGARRTPGATPCCSSASATSRCSAASSTCSPASAASQVVELPGRRRADGLLARHDSRRRAASTTPTVLRHWLPDLAERDVYVCGPPAWTDSARRRSPDRRAPGRPAPPRDLQLVT